MNWWSIISGIIGTATGIGGLIVAQLPHHTNGSLSTRLASFPWDTSPEKR
ncbi:hypothetical protein I6J24_06955 [Corynebacterium kroppenstedtii]|nr:hypothetical protein [Corynebacterium pseudokroppenstedtii]MDK7147203.1 hypothetical protein [Corynebacterium pseudokroppenstedtii]QRP13857.1 hypothetical protein I6J24_06955 [Corynebacterium kroppenstedtii]